MTLSEYQKLAARTEKPLSFEGRLMHGTIGLTTEIGELADTVKRAVIYGKELDRANIAEELGDILWYAAVIANATMIDMDDVTFQNIDKLRKRYPEKYSDADALARADKNGVEQPGPAPAPSPADDDYGGHLATVSKDMDFATSLLARGDYVGGCRALMVISGNINRAVQDVHRKLAQQHLQEQHA